MTLAMGDALSVALLENRKFSAGDFSVFHPGGQLGAKLLHVKDIMHDGKSVPLVQSGTLMTDAIMQISQKGFGCVGVTNKSGGHHRNYHRRDLARHLSPTLMSERVDDVMTRAPQTVAPGELASVALEILNSKAISALMVTKGKKPVGILHFHDLPSRWHCLIGNVLQS